ncbi:MAG TPA: hypothetical protein VK752_15250 [Bryobacteraceae bacterium]|jgi:hypothetical protein|nr:hypothetical protein [Bryobacteraceae bacterium]
MSEFLFYMHDGPRTFRFELSGTLAGAEVGKLDQAWRTASSTFDGKALAVDLTFLTSVDEKGRDLLLRWWRAGAHLVANTENSRGLAESVTGRPYEAADAVVGPTFDPHFNTSAFRAVAGTLIVAVTLLFPPTASADGASEAGAILERYSASLADGGLDKSTVTLEVQASMPKFRKQARVEAIRRWTDGKREYQFVAIEGDRLVRKEMIARYFSIDSQQSPLAAPITQSNYKFKFVTVNNGAVSVFQITPRKKRKGMIAGELWIDNETGLVTHLSGRLVKSPSRMLRGIQITQEMEIRHGVTFARDTHLDIETRFTGRAELTIHERTRPGETEVAENVAP